MSHLKTGSEFEVSFAGLDS